MLRHGPEMINYNHLSVYSSLDLETGEVTLDEGSRVVITENITVEPERDYILQVPLESTNIEIAFLDDDGNVIDSISEDIDKKYFFTTPPKAMFLKFSDSGNKIRKGYSLRTTVYDSENLVKNGLLNVDHVGELIIHAKENTYEFLDQVQRDNVVLERANFKFTKFNLSAVTETVPTIRHKYKAYLEYSLVNGRNKLSFKKSGLKNKELSIFDISENHRIFDKNFIAFIDGVFVDCINIIHGDGEISLVVNIINGTDNIGVTEETFRDWQSRDVDVNLIFFANSSFNPLITNRQILSENSKYLSLLDSGILDELENDSKYLSFITRNSLGYSSNLVNTYNKERMTEFFKTIDNSPPSPETSFINIFGFRNLSEIRTIPSGINMFQLPGYDMPIPVENIVVFRQTPEGKKYAPEISILRNYPNFYSVLNNDDSDELSLLIFYSENNNEDVLTDDIVTYYEIMGGSAEIFDLAPESIKEYEPFKVKYDIPDYRSSDIFNDLSAKLAETESFVDDGTLEYKISKMNEIIEANPEVLKRYLKEQPTTADNVLINVGKINLNERVRLDNMTEVLDSSRHMAFEEDRYIFRFRNFSDRENSDFRLFIDGKFHTPDIVFNDNDFIFVYLPTTLIKEDSIIEVERFIIGDETIEFTSSYIGEEFTIKVPKNLYVYEDIFVVNLDTGFIIPSTCFKFFKEFEDGRREELIPESFELIDAEKIVLSIESSDALPFNLRLHVQRKSLVFSDVVAEENDRHIFNFQLQGNSRKEYMRVFANGRFVNNLYPKLEFNGSYQGQTTVTHRIHSKGGEEVILDYTPNNYEQVLWLVNMPANNVLYLHGLLDRPFDLSWYDLYVNGRKMNKYNVEVFSPYLIQIKDVDAVWNIEIYSKRRDLDTFSLNGKTTLIDQLWLTDEAFRGKVLSRPNNSTDNELDILVDAMYAYLDDLYDLFKNDVEGVMGVINPDIQQLPDELVDRYPLVFDTLYSGNNNIIHISGDVWEGTKETRIMYINPDLEI